MNNIHGFRALVIKTLAIVGFIATAVLLIWLSIQGLKHLPGAFASLASIAESIREYRPTRDLTLSTEKAVVNSGESLTFSWTDMRENDGAYVLSYACISGVTLEVRTHTGELKKLTCTEKLPLSPLMQTLTVNVISPEDRFVDVPVTIAFKSARTEITKESTAKVTVVNASIPSGVLVDVIQTPQDIETPVVDTTAEEKPVIETPEVSTPSPVLVYPTSNPYGFTDLSITTTGIGIIERGVFTYTPGYEDGERTAIKFEVKNIGTKTSDTWLFRSILPNGEIYTSPTQPALRPGERIEFTLAFDFDDSSRDDFVKITNTLRVDDDVNLKNNESVWHIRVID